MSPLPPPLQTEQRTYVRAKSRLLSYFAGCDYYRLSSHPRVLQALRTGLDRHGLSVSASRLTTGNHRAYGALEAALTEFFDAPTATLCSLGYTPNLIVAQALAGRFTHALLDARSHGSLQDAAQFLDCPILKFPHRDPAGLAELLQRLSRSRPLVMTDGLFSHDGSAAPLADYLALLPPEGRLLVDDAHGAGLLGARGQGALEHAAVPRDRIIQTLTLSKAFGVYGGAVLGPPELRDAIFERSRMFVGSTPLPLPLAHAAGVAVRHLRAHPRLRTRLQDIADRFKADLRAAGYSLPDHPGPIVPIVPRDATDTRRWEQRLLKAAIHPPLIRYLGGPANGYFRFVLSSEHTPAQVNALRTVFRELAPD